jgi:hypothetical protein
MQAWTGDLESKALENPAMIGQSAIKHRLSTCSTCVLGYDIHDE